MLSWLVHSLKAIGPSRFGDQRGAISPLMALMIIPIAGATATVAEMGQWYYFQRAMQNAADSAALAAATNANASGTGSTYLAEARAAAQKFGFVNGQNHVTVTAAANGTCPSGVTSGSVCYSATLTTQVPLGLSALIGFRGNVSGGYAQTILATAIATTANSGTGGGGATTGCIGTLSTGTNSFTSNGGPKPDLAGCTIISHGGATCNGHDLGADYGIAAGTDSGCGKQQISGATIPPDAYGSYAKNIPANPCGGKYPTEPVKKNDPALPASNLLSGSMTLPTTLCGDVQLTGNVTLTGSNTLTIFNGTLDLNGYTLQTASGASATLIFSGNNSASSLRAPTGGGTLSIQAPSNGNWSGVAIYQDPNMKPPQADLDVSYSGNQPTWNITGLVYLPNSNVTFSGAVNKSANGVSCFVLVAYTVLVNGTGSIFANNTQCGSAGLIPPSGGGVTREKLVQ